MWRFQHLRAEARALLVDDPSAAKTRLEAALALWRGEALGGVPDGALSVERAQLEDERLEALEMRIDADLALGEGASVVGELQRLRQAHPARERFTEQLMLGLYRSGRQAEALEAYRAAYSGLRDELGLEPGPALRELEQSILRHDEALGPLPLRARVVGASRRRPRLALAALGSSMLVAFIVVAALGSAHPRRLAPRPGLILLDAATGAVRAELPLGDSQGSTRFGYGHLWTLGENGVMSEVDPRYGTLVRSIPVGVLAGGIAVGAGGIWVSDRNGPTLLRIDPVTGRINLRAQLSNLGLRRPEPNMGIAFDAGSLWVARGAEAVDRLDPSSLRLQRRIELGRQGCEAGTGAQCAVAAGAGHVWVAGGNGGWPGSTRRQGARPSSQDSIHTYVAWPWDGGSVWVAEAHDIARLAPDGRLRRRYPFSSDGIGDMAYDDRSLWASADSTGQLLRIDAQTGEMSSIHLGNLLIGASASHGIVAVNALPSPTEPTLGFGARVLRIGLTDDWLNNSDPAVTRPASGTGRWQWQLHHATCAQVYMHPDGGSFRTLVPELAKGPARASSHGRTWTIAIRTDLRFSPPLNRPVTPEDVRATLIRALSPELGPAAPAARILHDVVGLAAYRRRQSSDVSGVRLRHGMLQITTRRPERNLPARLVLVRTA